MADTELKKLNKTVEDAVNILKLYVGNSAQVKNMNEKQRQAIEKWFDVTEQQEEQVKRQRAFTERERDEQGRFVKKQEAMAFSFMGIAQSISGIFMGMAKGIGSAIGNIAKGITSHLRNFFSAIKSHFLGLFGEESEWFDILGGIKDAVTGFFGWFIRGFMFLFRKTPSWARKMIGILSGMYALQIKQMKMDFLEDSGVKKKMGIWGILGMILFAVAAGIGAWLHRKLLVLNTLWEGFKVTKLFRYFKYRFMDFWMKLDDFAKWLQKLPIIGRVLKGLKFGLKWLGWPLTILLSIIDFIKAWKAETGDWQDKLFAGLKAVFHGILDFPLEILGWVWDKLMGLFGIESTGTGDKLKKWFDDIMGFMFEWGPIGIITDIIKGFTDEGGFKAAFQDKADKLQNVFLTIMDFVGGVWNSFLDWVSQKVQDIPWVGDDLANITEGLKAEPKKPVVIKKDIPKLVSAHEKRKIEMQQEQSDQVKKAIDETTKATKDNAAKTNDVIQGMSLVSSHGGGGGSVEQKQIPDELDNQVLSVKNYSGDMD